MNVATIKLDGGIKSNLFWEREIDYAKRMVQEGKRLLWEIDLGLFSRLPMQLSSQSQYLALGISLEHFRTHIWSSFEDVSLGVCYYNGSADFTTQFQGDVEHEDHFREWLKEVFLNLTTFELETGIAVNSFDEVFLHTCKHLHSLYSRNVAAHYFLLLSKQLSAHIPSYIFLDVSPISSSLLKAQLTDSDLFSHFQLVIKGCPWNFLGLQWEEGIFKNGDALDSRIGVCLPSYKSCRPSHYKGLEHGIDWLLHHHISFRVIPESMLVTHWDGLDYLIYVPGGLNESGKRQLQGFCAAGGSVVSVGKKQGFVEELNFEEFVLKFS